MCQGEVPGGLARVSLVVASRRRHPRCSRDWSSDVCSSDLQLFPDELIKIDPPALPRQENLVDEIGRASCRERAEISVVAVSLKKKTPARRLACAVRRVRSAPLPRTIKMTVGP